LLDGTAVYMFSLCHFQNNKGGDTSKTLVQTVKHERNQLEEKLEREKIQTFHLKTELADVENKNVELTQVSNTTLRTHLIVLGNSICFPCSATICGVKLVLYYPLLYFFSIHKQLLISHKYFV
jgi:hypothetical protein